MRSRDQNITLRKKMFNTDGIFRTQRQLVIKMEISVQMRGAADASLLDSKIVQVHLGFICQGIFPLLMEKNREEA